MSADSTGSCETGIHDGFSVLVTVSILGITLLNYRCTHMQPRSGGISLQLMARSASHQCCQWGLKAAPRDCRVPLQCSSLQQTFASCLPIPYPELEQQARQPAACAVECSGSLRESVCSLWAASEALQHCQDGSGTPLVGPRLTGFPLALCCAAITYVDCLKPLVTSWPINGVDGERCMRRPCTCHQLPPANTAGQHLLQPGLGLLLAPDDSTTTVAGCIRPGSARITASSSHGSTCSLPCWHQFNINDSSGYVTQESKLRVTYC